MEKEEEGEKVEEEMQVRVELVHSSGWSTSLTRLMGANQRFITHPYNAQPSYKLVHNQVHSCSQPW